MNNFCEYVYFCFFYFYVDVCIFFSVWLSIALFFHMQHECSWMYTTKCFRNLGLCTFALISVAFFFHFSTSSRVNSWHSDMLKAASRVRASPEHCFFYYLFTSSFLPCLFIWICACEERIFKLCKRVLFVLLGGHPVVAKTIMGKGRALLKKKDVFYYLSLTAQKHRLIYYRGESDEHLSNGGTVFSFDCVCTDWLFTGKLCLLQHVRREHLWYSQRSTFSLFVWQKTQAWKMYKPKDGCFIIVKVHLIQFVCFSWRLSF